MQNDGMDNLIELCAIHGVIAGGSALRKSDNRTLARFKGGTKTQHKVDPSANGWSKEEIFFLRKSIGHLSMKEIADHLGRSETAVKVKSTRHGFPTASKFPGTITTEKMARLFRVDTHTISRLRDQGLLETQIAKTKYRMVHLVCIRTIYRWATRPRNWLYFKAARIMDPHLRRLVIRAQSLWKDEWWSPGQVAEYWGIHIATVNNETNKGRFIGIRWGNWWYLKSDALNHNFFPGTGKQWSPRADEWILKARDELNMNYKDIAVRMKGDWTIKTITYRYKLLKKNRPNLGINSIDTQV